MQITMAHSLGCSAFVLAHFGEDTPRGYSSYYDHLPPVADTLESFKSACRHAVDYNDTHTDSYNKVKDQAIVVAYTISRQPMAEKFLSELGFRSFNSGPYNKYSGHTATLWFMTAQEFLNAIKE